MSRPEVSVVMATRDYGRYLDSAVESVRAQTYRDWELIIIDDGSTDDTPERIRRYADDPRIRSDRTDGLGQPRAKNLGIRLARGEFVAFLDGDDAWMPTKLERQLPLFADPQVGVVYADRELMDADGRPLTAPPRTLTRGAVFDDILMRNPVCFSSAVVRRGVWDAVGLFDESLDLAIDFDLWLRVARHYTFDFVPEPLVRYRTGHGNLSRRIHERIATVFRIMQRAVDRCGPDRPISAAVRGEAWGSTYRTSAFVNRLRNRRAAVADYFRAARADGRWWASIRSIVGTLLGR